MPKPKQQSSKSQKKIQKSPKNYTGKRPQTVCRRTATKDPLHQPTSASQYEAPRQIAGKLFTRHMFVSAVHFVSQDPLQESCLRFMSYGPPMRICYKIHIFGFMSQHLCVSGSSARSMSLDSCLSIHVYLRILCKIHVAGFIAQQPYVSQDPLQDPRLRIHVSASLYLTDALQDPRQRLRIHVSASLYLRILCKIHVSGSMSPIQVSASICISGTSARSMSPDPYISIQIYLRILCKIHVSDSCLSIFIPQGPLQDPCLRIHVSASTCISGTSARSMSPDPFISIHMYLKLLCKIHVSGSVYQNPYVSQDPLQDPCLRIRI